MNAIDVKPDSIWSDKKYTLEFMTQYHKKTTNKKNLGQAHWRMRTGEKTYTTDKKKIKKQKLTVTMKNKKGVKVWLLSDGTKKSFINGYLKGTPYKECHAPVRAYVDYILKEQLKKIKKDDDYKFHKINDKKALLDEELKLQNVEEIRSLKRKLEESKKDVEYYKLETKTYKDFLMKGDNPIFSSEYQCDNNFDIDKCIKKYTPHHSIIYYNKIYAELQKENEKLITEAKQNKTKINNLETVVKQYDQLFIHSHSLEKENEKLKTEAKLNKTKINKLLLKESDYISSGYRYTEKIKLLKEDIDKLKKVIEQKDKTLSNWKNRWIEEFAKDNDCM